MEEELLKQIINKLDKIEERVHAIEIKQDLEREKTKNIEVSLKTAEKIILLLLRTKKAKKDSIQESLDSIMNRIEKQPNAISENDN